MHNLRRSIMWWRVGFEHAILIVMLVFVQLRISLHLWASSMNRGITDNLSLDRVVTVIPKPLLVIDVVQWWLMRCSNGVFDIWLIDIIASIRSATFMSPKSIPTFNISLIILNEGCNTLFHWTIYDHVVCTHISGRYINSFLNGGAIVYTKEILRLCLIPSLLDSEQFLQHDSVLSVYHIQSSFITIPMRHKSVINNPFPQLFIYKGIRQKFVSISLYP